MAEIKLEFEQAPADSAEGRIRDHIKQALIICAKQHRGWKELVDDCCKLAIERHLLTSAQICAVQSAAQRLAVNPGLAGSIAQMLDRLLYASFGELGMLAVAEDMALTPDQRAVLIGLMVEVAKDIMRAEREAIDGLLSWEFQMPDWQVT